MKNILITNDDGYQASGLKALIEVLSCIANVTVVAPSTEQSACGHSLTLTKPLKMIKINKNFYKLDNGTPTDCVFIALNQLFEKKPDLVVSGINLGSNMGEDITYSGTASAAMEAVLQGVPAIAISQVFQDKNDPSNNNWDFALAKETIKNIVLKILNTSFPLDERKFLNINIPNIEIAQCKGIKISRAGYRTYNNETVKNLNPKGEEYYWIGLHPLIWKVDNNSNQICDFETIKNNYISITPIKLDMTSKSDLNVLKNWIKEKEKNV